MQSALLYYVVGWVSLPVQQGMYKLWPPLAPHRSALPCFSAVRRG